MAVILPMVISPIDGLSTSSHRSLLQSSPLCPHWDAPDDCYTAWPKCKPGPTTAAGAPTNGPWGGLSGQFNQPSRVPAQLRAENHCSIGRFTYYRLAYHHILMPIHFISHHPRNSPLYPTPLPTHRPLILGGPGLGSVAITLLS